MNELQSGFIGEIPRRMFDITAAGSPMQLYSPILIGTQVLENDRPEYKYLAQTRLAGVKWPGLAAVPAQYVSCTIFNPVGSQSLFVHESSLIIMAGGASCNIYVTKTQLPLTVRTPQCMDSRWQVAGTLAKPTAQCSSATTVMNPPEGPIGFLPPSLSTYFNRPLIISPGWSITFQLDTVNVGFGGGFSNWYEKPISNAQLP